MTSATTRCSDGASILSLRRALADDSAQDGRDFTSAYTAALDTWLDTLLGDAGEGVALVAVGSYGRGELCPGSDLDLVLVHRRRRDVTEIADRMWYPIWDAGLRLDHSVRTVGEALDAARQDLKVQLGLLDARVVAGDADLGAELARSARELWRRHAPRWLEPLEEQCRARHARSGEVAYLLEPDLKEGRGGQRDITVLRALAPLGVEACRRPGLLRAAATLLSVRVALHGHARRAEEHLFLEDQEAVATALGLRDAHALMARVATAGRTVTWVFDDAWRALKAPARRRFPRTAAVGPGIEVLDDEIVVSQTADPCHDDSLLLRVAEASAYFGCPIAGSAVERLREATPRMTRRWSDEARRAFVALLGAGDVSIALVEGLDQLGLWTRVIPEWAAVRSLPQRNAFHRYTVDRHLLETVARATRLVRRVARPDLLLVGALLHDLGKGFPGDHTDAGVELAAMLASRMGFPDHDVDVLVDMVRYHLLLPAVATSRDLDDEATITAVADAVGSVQLLELLHALVEADSVATGDTAWSPWKAELVQDLVHRVGGRFRGVPHHTVPLDPPEPSLTSRFDGTLTVDIEGDHVSVVAPDRQGLFATVVGVLALHGHNVRAGRARSSDDGIAVSAFDIEATREAADAGAIERDVNRALAGELALASRLADRAANERTLRRPTAAHPAQALVMFDSVGSPNATIVEVRAPDGIGVLYATTSVLAALGLDIRHAKVSTLGHEVIDTFYVVDSDGKKVVDEHLLENVEGAVLDALAKTEGPLPSEHSSMRQHPGDDP